MWKIFNICELQYWTFDLIVWVILVGCLGILLLFFGGVWRRGWKWFYHLISWREISK